MQYLLATILLSLCLYPIQYVLREPLLSKLVQSLFMTLVFVIGSQRNLISPPLIRQHILIGTAIYSASLIISSFIGSRPNVFNKRHNNSNATVGESFLEIGMAVTDSLFSFTINIGLIVLFVVVSLIC